MVSALITTYNSARFLARCIDSLQRQTYKPLEIIVVDNCSTDETRTILEGLRTEIRVIFNDTNVGFAAGQNQAARAAKGSWLFSVNPDVLLEVDFIAQLVAAGDVDPTFGAVCGKLLRWSPDHESEFSQTIDSTGIYFTPNLRHLDRGADQADQGQYEQPELVFGATGAAALYRRSMWEDVSVEGEFFDEQFFAYREDADVAWRAQLMGWKCLYVPEARGWHVRRVTPERRQNLPLAINFHSIKNRFLMRAKNTGWGLCWRTFFPATARDALILGYALLRDWRMLSALAYPLRHWNKVRLKRRWIQSRRRVSDADIARWLVG